MKPETKSLTKKMIDTVTRKKEQAKILKDMQDTITIALEAMKYEILEEEQLKNILKEIAETTTRIPCNVINHPTTTVKDLLNTPNTKINQVIRTQTVACSEVKLHEINQLNITFTIETIEIQTPAKRYTMITNIAEVKPSY